MNKLLIAIASCNRDSKNGFNQAIRDTWLKDASVNYKFFLGSGSTDPREDEIILNCPDDYLSLPQKTLEILRWALKEGYDYIYKCDTDTFVMPEKLLESGFENYDYVGTFNGDLGIPNFVYSSLYSWASGGSGYCVSKKSADIILREGVTGKAMCPRLHIPCEDLWIGQVLGPGIRDKSLKAHDDSRYGRHYTDDYKTDISSHYCSEGMKRKFDVSWMFKHYNTNK